MATITYCGIDIQVTGNTASGWTASCTDMGMIDVVVVSDGDHDSDYCRKQAIRRMKVQIYASHRDCVGINMGCW